MEKKIKILILSIILILILIGIGLFIWWYGFSPKVISRETIRDFSESSLETIPKSAEGYQIRYKNSLIHLNKVTFTDSLRAEEFFDEYREKIVKDYGKEEGDIILDNYKGIMFLAEKNYGVLLKKQENVIIAWGPELEKVKSAIEWFFKK